MQFLVNGFFYFLTLAVISVLYTSYLVYRLLCDEEIKVETFGISLMATGISTLVTISSLILNLS